MLWRAARRPRPSRPSPSGFRIRRHRRSRVHSAKRAKATTITKSQVFSALIDTIDLSQLAKLEADAAREEIRDIVNDIIAIKNFAMSIAEQGRPARRHLQRRPGLRAARAASGARRDRRHHGQRRQARLHRSRRQGGADHRPLPRQPQLLTSASASSARSAGASTKARRSATRAFRRQPRQRHRAAARHRRQLRSPSASSRRTS